MRWTYVVDHSLPFAFLASAGIGFALGLEAGLPPSIASAGVVGSLAALAAALERLRPERRDYAKWDQPVRVEVLHFVLNYNLGYLLALGACALVSRGVGALSDATLWPVRWPLLLQVVFAGVLAEGVSYWQHRLVHRVRWLWPFHALHHGGVRLNLARAGRFHFVDIGTGVFMVFLPLALLRAPDAVLGWVGVTCGVLGVLQHANVRMRTPAWLDGVVCTPAVHRLHHSRDAAESDANFGTLFMVFDRLWGTYLPPSADGPRAVGVANEQLPRGFWRQVVDPFRRSHAARS
jgi:lathosterol oxidase